MNEKEFLEGVGTVCEYASKLSAILLKSNADFAEINVANNVDFGLLNEVSCEQGRRLQGSDEHEDYEPTIQSKRFDIFEVEVIRNPDLGCPRLFYMAWFRNEDVPRSVCEVSLFGGLVEWVHVCERYRREGIATEVISAIDEYIGGGLSMEGVTDSGVAFVESYYKSNIE